MKTREDIAEFIGKQDFILRLLEAVAALKLPDCWIGAGLIRNAVWDCLHDRKPQLSPGSDVDVIYFDVRSVTPEKDKSIEARLLENRPDIDWSVHNQALMHARNGDKAYRNTEDAIRHWPETATAIAARIQDNEIDVIAPYGVDDLINFVVRPTPAFIGKMDIYRARIARKKWPERWPKLSISYD